MKTAIRIFCLIFCLLCMAGCAGSREDGHEFRDQMEQTQSLGIWKDGRQIVAFSKSGHQYWCSPSERTIRIIDNEGMEYSELRLDKMPAEGLKTDGTLLGNMGAGPLEIRDLYILRHDMRNIWLWSDADNIGLILPKYGIL